MHTHCTHMYKHYTQPGHVSPTYLIYCYLGVEQETGTHEKILTGNVFPHNTTRTLTHIRAHTHTHTYTYTSRTHTQSTCTYTSRTHTPHALTHVHAHTHTPHVRTRTHHVSHTYLVHQFWAVEQEPIDYVGLQEILAGNFFLTSYPMFSKKKCVISFTRIHKIVPSFEQWKQSTLTPDGRV